MPDDLYAWLTLSSVPGLGPVALSNLVQRFGSPENVLRTPAFRLREAPGIGPETARSICQCRDEAWARDQIARAEDAGTRILTLTDPDYPPALRQIYAPPSILYVGGHIQVCHAPTVAMVGSRSFTMYGRDMARRLSAELAQQGITVVSGMAVGIDAHAHWGAIQGGGHTAAVLGSSLDCPYPSENLGLFRHICETGAAISEFPLSTSPEPHNFPRRNRIISGLSLGVVVIEAGNRSGALITVQHALEQNRDIFAVPGPIHSGKSTGTNGLIRQGAVLVQSVADILQEICPARLTPTPSSRHLPAPPPAPPLSGPEKKVLEALSDETPLHVDALAAATGFSLNETLTVLLSLELGEKAQQLPGKHFLRR